MALLNYSTEVPATRTITQIIAGLASAGARQVLTDYDAERRPTGVAFALSTAGGMRHYTMPVNVTAVEKVLRSQRIPPRYQNRDQAERVAWRILKDWIEAQLAIIETGMVSVDQVFLPYMLVGTATVYELYLDQQLELGPALLAVDP